MSGRWRLTRRAAVAVVCAGLVACGAGGEPGQAESKTYVIKFPHVVAPSTPKGQAAERFKAEAEARFPGRVMVEIYPSAQLMDDSDALDAALAMAWLRLSDDTQRLRRLTNFSWINALVAQQLSNPDTS